MSGCIQISSEQWRMDGWRTILAVCFENNETAIVDNASKTEDGKYPLEAFVKTHRLSSRQTD
jgi:hypothetical protein